MDFIEARKILSQEPDIFPFEKVSLALEGSFVISKALYLRSGYVDLVLINDLGITTLVFFKSLSGKEELKTALIEMLECGDELVKGRYYDFLSKLPFNFDRNPFNKYAYDDIKSYENITPLGERQFSILIISEDIDEDLMQFEDYIRPYCHRNFDVTLLHLIDSEYIIDIEVICSFSSNEI